MAEGPQGARGTRAHLSGQAAEAQVARAYLALGAEILATRWRGRAGEIDLIARMGRGLIFVEVKRAPTHAQAAARITPAQIRRIGLAALEYAAALDPPPDMRFDAALVDGQGVVEILENALVQDGM